MATETVDELLGSEERIRVALEASWKMESIADALIEASQGLDASDLAIRGLSIRVKGLANVAMSALGDDAEPIAEIRKRLTGQPCTTD